MYDARARYRATAVETASPERLVIMLYDRLLLDLDRAVVAFEAGDRGAGTPLVRHAQDIVSELMAALDRDGWNGADDLMSIYRYVLGQLLQAGLTGDGARVVECRELLGPLAAAWHEAADSLGRQGAPAPAPGSRDASAPAGAGMLGVA